MHILCYVLIAAITSPFIILYLYKVVDTKLAVRKYRKIIATNARR